MQKVKVGDTVKILAVDFITAEWQPKLLNSEQVVTGFDVGGDPMFAWDEPNLKGCPYGRQHGDSMVIEADAGWRFELVEG